MVAPLMRVNQPMIVITRGTPDVHILFITTVIDPRSTVTSPASQMMPLLSIIASTALDVHLLLKSMDRPSIINEIPKNCAKIREMFIWLL